MATSKSQLVDRIASLTEASDRERRYLEQMSKRHLEIVLLLVRRVKGGDT